jgi:hypothetical protein
VLTFVVSMFEGCFRGRQTMFRFLWRPRHLPHIFAACFPKSGSTYLCKVLQALTGFQSGYVAEHGKHNDQDISPRKLRSLKTSTVIQQHAKGTYNNLRILRQFELRPIVNVRNIYDVIVSLHDHLRNEDDRVPTGYVHREYWNLSYREQLDYLIGVHLPWYFNFVVSWHEASEELPIFVSTYERLMTNPSGVLRQIAEFYSMDVSDQAIESAFKSVEGQSTRLNHGIMGRGQAELSHQQRETIWRLARVWHVDQTVWDLVGLRPESLAA